MSDRDAFPALRCFIFGAEVTDDVERISITSSDSARAPGAAEIVLATETPDKYIVTPDDMVALVPGADAVQGSAGEVQVFDYKDLDEALNTQPAQLRLKSQPSSRFGLGNLADPVAAVRISTAAAMSAYDEATERLLKERVRDPLKQAILLEKTKAKYRTQVMQPQAGGGKAADATTLAYLRGEATAYPFQCGEMIFHSADPVRIYLRDPFRPQHWFHAFAGFVSGGGEENDADNQQQVTIHCEDVLRVARYARFSTGAGIFDVKALQLLEEEVVRTFQDDDFTGLNLIELIYTMFFGSVAAQVDPEQLRTVDKKAVGGIRAMQQRVGIHGTTQRVVGDASGLGGAFNISRSRIVLYGNKEPHPELTASLARYTVDHTGTNLAPYLALVDHRVYPSDIETMLLAGEQVSGAGLLADTIEDVITEVGEHPERYPVDGGRLFILAPATLGPNTSNSILSLDFKGVELKTTWRTRLSRLYDVLERIQFSMFASPRGDVLIEMPLFSFDPIDFGDVPVIINGPSGEETRGPFGPAFVLTPEDTSSWNRNFEDEQVRTQCSTSWYPVGNKGAAVYNDRPGSAAPFVGPPQPPNTVGRLKAAGTGLEIGQQPRVRTLRSMVPAFGVRLEAVEPTVYLGSPEAADTYADIKLSMLNANARRLTPAMMPNLQLIPNRPILHVERQTVATYRRVTQSLVWGEGGGQETQGETNYVRAWTGQFEERGGRKRPVYAAIGGLMSEPIDWARLFA